MSASKPLRHILAVYSLAQISHRDHFRGVLDFCCRKPDWCLHLGEPGRPFPPLPGNVGYDGYVISLPADDASMRALALEDKPVVLVNIDGRTLPRRTRNFSTVWFDNADLGRRGADYLLRLGSFAAYAFVGDADGQFYNRERERAFCARIAESGRTASVARDGFGLDGFLLGLPKPAAVMCASGTTALRVEQHAARLRIPIPAALALLSSDEFSSRSEGAGISCFRQNAAAMGFAAAMELDAIISKGGGHDYREILITAGGISERRSTRRDCTAARRLRTALETIDGRIAQIASLDDLSRLTGIPRRTLSADFKSLSPDSPKAAIDRARFAKAQSLLLHGLPFREAARAAGYRSANALSKAFRRQLGQCYRSAAKPAD